MLFELINSARFWSSEDFYTVKTSLRLLLIFCQYG